MGVGLLQRGRFPHTGKAAKTEYEAAQRSKFLACEPKAPDGDAASLGAPIARLAYP
jgi:hypothetical protein